MVEKYVGICLRTPRLEEREQGKVLPIGRLTQAPGGSLVLDRTFEFQELGPSESVFWPLIPPDPPASLDGRLVEFEIEKNPLQFGKTEPGKDWYQVARSHGNTEWRISPLVGGSYVVDEEHANWRDTPRKLRGVPTGSRVYLHDKRGSQIFGPWTVREGEIHPDSSDYVRRFPIAILGRETVVKQDRILRKSGVSGLLFILLSDPPFAEGCPFDIATSKRKAEWLRKRLQARAGTIVERLDREHPRWKQDLTAALGEVEDPTLRDVYNERATAIASILDAVKIDDLSAIIEAHPRFQAALDAARENALKAEAESIREKATRETQGYRREAERARDEVRKTREAELEKVDLRLQEHIERLRETQEEMARTQVEVEAREARIRKAAERLEEARERIVDEFMAFKKLLPTLEHRVQEKPIPPSELYSPGRTPVGNAVESPAEFVRKRLHPAFARWVPHTRPSFVELFHCAVLGCRWIIVPAPSWGKAYEEAMGGTAVLTVVPVSPSWIRFEDAWGDAVEACWRRALGDLERLHLLFLVDVNRALPQCWGRAWLDLLAGFRDSLPTRDSPPWPNNLRVLCSRATDEAVLPLPAHVLHCWGAVSEDTGGDDTNPLRDAECAHLPLPRWIEWTGDLPAPGEVLPEATKLGPLSQAGSQDLRRLKSVVRSLKTDFDDETARRWATRIRIEEPQKYLDPLHNERA